ncbi:MAG: CHAT domain-containing protein [Deltaproteobacteria bacterium]|nr:MAG: CHAT domain-containing protein [Deltaproteobacteria bacterium]TMQ23309.1 MAG: CHAT domain-containing protein [Deltaproteobacteria bacterium]
MIDNTLTHDFDIRVKGDSVIYRKHSPSPKVRVPCRRARRPRSTRNLILFLATNSGGTNQLALDRECAAIESELRMSPNREDFELCSKWAVSVDEMARHLMQLQPTIIHFSGHGICSERVRSRPSSRDRDVGIAACSNGGIYLKNEHGGPQIVPARALTMMIRSAAASARVVVLNACYSDAQACELCTAVDCVVGMAGVIHDDDARSFSVGFYRARGNRRSVGNALDHAVATLAAKQLADEHVPRLRTRDGVDARQVVLTSAT